MVLYGTVIDIEDSSNAVGRISELIDGHTNAEIDADCSTIVTSTHPHKEGVSKNRLGVSGSGSEGVSFTNFPLSTRSTATAPLLENLLCRLESMQNYSNTYVRMCRTYEK